MNNNLNNKMLKEKYDQIFNDGAYENYFTFNSYSIFEEIVAATNWENKDVLDIGCGEGELSAMISFAGAKRVHAIDYSKKAIELSKNRINLESVFFE